MHPQRAPIAFAQNLEISSRLSRFYHAKGKFLPRNRNVDGIVAGYLKEDSRIGTTFICLSGRVQETRPETKAGRNSLSLANHMTRGLQRLLVSLIHLDVAK